MQLPVPHLQFDWSPFEPWDHAVSAASRPYHLANHRSCQSCHLSCWTDSTVRQRNDHRSHLRQSFEIPGYPFRQAPVSGAIRGSECNLQNVLALFSTGDLRFRLPQPIPAYTGSLTATAYGLSCPQQAVDLPIVSGLAAEAIDFIVNSIYGLIFPDSEDCK